MAAVLRQASASTRPRGTSDHLVLPDHAYTDGTAAWHGDRVRDEYELAPFRAFVPGTRLASMVPGPQTATSNSIHHQVIKDLAPRFVVEARCPEDGRVEETRRQGPGHVAGMQWPPDFHQPDHPVTLGYRPILYDFLAAARAARG